MILSCNSCEKKFVVPDQAISAVGRMVQCGSCGNKWKQFPNKTGIKKITSAKNIISKTKPGIAKITNTKSKKVKKPKEISLYSPEYLKKKHGISLKSIDEKKGSKVIQKVSFGFYNSIILFVVISIAFIKSLHFFLDIIIQKIPLTEFYLNYFFENIRNIFEIWKNLLSKY
jgi:predicted Zn finger-like uncharacterized protein